MTVQLASFDTGLPGLQKALDRDHLGPRLDALLRDPQAGGDPWQLLDVEVVKHKPGRRCALAYTLRAPDGRAKRLFAKTFKNDRGATIFLNMARFAGALQGAEPIVPRPLGYLPDARLLITEFLEGRSLAPPLYEGEDEQPARRAAAALAGFQGCDLRCARRWDAERELRNTVEWIRGLTGRSPAAQGRSQRLADRLAMQVPRLGGVEERPIHRDFYPEQLWDCAGRTAVLDLDDARSGDPAVDVGNFLAHLRLRSIQFPEATEGCRRARELFLEEYPLHIAGSADEVLARVPFYEATTLLRLSGVYAARQRWAAILPVRLVEACEAVLDAEGIR